MTRRDLMSKPRVLADDILEDDLRDLDIEGVALPPHIQARWRKHEAARKMPRERERSGEREKPHRGRRHSD
jgi:hypothetical protein